MNPIFDSRTISLNRSRALARSAAKADFLLNIAADEIAERLMAVERQFERGVELHGTTGIAAARCLATGKVDAITRIETGPEFLANGVGITADLETVPLEPGSVNLILSPLMAHLTNDTPGLFIQIRRSLAPDGLFLGAVPGAGTLAELRDALLAAEIELSGGASPRIIPFPDVRDVGSLMQRAGFALPVIDMETYTVRYDSLFPLMRDLQNMGMANPLAARSRHFASRSLFMRAAEIYAERYSDPDGRIRATFSIIYVSGWAPHESQQKPLRPGSAKVRLADALKAAEYPADTQGD